MTHLTGKQFKLRYPFTKFIVIDEIFDDDDYILFFKQSYFKKELKNNENTKYKWNITIHDDAYVIYEDNIFKCNRFTLSNKVSLIDYRKYRPDLAKKKCMYWTCSTKEVLEDLMMYDISIDYRRFMNLDESSRTYNVSLYTLSRNGIALSHVPIDIQDKELVEAAVNDNWAALEFVRNDLKTLELCMIAFEKNHYAYRFFKDEYKNDELQQRVDSGRETDYVYYLKQGIKISVSGKA